MLLRLLARLPLLTLASAAVAQFTPAPPRSDADRLAADMRLIAANPQDAGALADAGEASIRVGDLSGAGSLFARAELVAPRDGRVKAGQGLVLLQMERPGEALRYFAQAEAFGYPAARFAGERALAYDLVGQQARAEQDYRRALAEAPDDETVRRYALSLAIAGQREAALLQLDPLLRRGDRGAWRARAFVLAMNGEVAEADRIATVMMGPSQGPALAPFFARLASLGPADRAFAVQFGELRPTPQRIADARLAPALPALAPEIVPVPRPAPVQVAAVQSDKKRRGKKAAGVQLAVVAPPPLPEPPSYGAPRVALVQRPAAPAIMQALPTAAPPAPNTPTGLAAAFPARRNGAAAPNPGFSAASTSPALSFAPSRRPAETPQIAAVRPASPPQVSAPLSNLPSRRQEIASAAPPSGIAPAPVAVPRVAAAAPSTAIAGPPSSLPANLTPVASATRPGDLAAAPPAPKAPASAPISPAPARVDIAQAAPPQPISPQRVAQSAPIAPPSPELTGVEVAEARRPSMPVPFSVAPPPRPTPPARVEPPAPVRTDALPASSAAEAAPVPVRPPAGLTPPARSLADAVRDLAPQAAPSPAQTGPFATVAALDPDAPMVNGHLTEAGRRLLARSGSASDGASGQLAASVAPPVKPPAPGAAAIAAADAAAKRAAAKQAAADKKLAAERKAAAEAKAEEVREAAEKRRIERADPKRYWVQVAGGANPAGLPSAWATMQAHAPALAGRHGWTTPLRFTNRVLAGPFKTEEEARAFKNTVIKQGVPATQFTSEPGQKVTRLESE